MFSKINEALVGFVSRFEREVRACGIHLMKPIQEWLCRFYYDR